MKRKLPNKAYWEMNTEQLRDATKEFDEEFVAAKANPLTPSLKARWERAKARPSRAENGNVQMTITVCLTKDLLDQCTALAKKKRINRDTLIARGLKALLVAEGNS